MNVVANITSMSVLQEFIRKHRIRVVRKPSSVMMGYAGLHIEAGEDWGLKIPANTVWIDQNLRGRDYYKTLKHEIEEMLLMRDGMKYIPAHKIALKHEVLR
jgi:hypothetical protein